MRRRRVKKAPFMIYLPLSAVVQERGLYNLIASDPRWTRHQVRMLHNLFALQEDERRFALELLRNKPNFWVFRSNQRCFCADFLLVDMSSPTMFCRRVFVVELKQNAALRLEPGPAGIQFRNAAFAVRRLAARTGAIPPEAPFQRVVGAVDQLLTYLGSAGEASP